MARRMTPSVANNYDSGKPCVCYTRYSSKNQTDDSIKYQMANINRYAEYRKYKIVKHYSDKAKTGTNSKRPQFQEMLKDALNNPPWDKIIVYRFSRYFRNTKEARECKDNLLKNGILVISVVEDFGKPSSSSRYLEDMTFAGDAHQSNVTGEITYEGMKIKAKAACHCGGIAPLGYDISKKAKKKKLKINQHEAEAVRLIFDLYERNYSYTKIAEQLNSLGYRTKTGKKFNKHSFTSILSQEKYTGTYIWNKTFQRKTCGFKGERYYNPDEEYIRVQGGCAQIITPEQFERVQKLRAERANGKATSKQRAHYMLSGLGVLICSECGSFLIGETSQSHGKKYKNYYCPKHKEKMCSLKPIKAEELDRFVAGRLAKDLYNRNDIKDINTEMKRNEDSKALSDSLKGKMKAMRNVRKAIEADCDDSLIERYAELRKEVSNLERQIAKAQSTAPIITDDNKKSICNRFARYLINSENIEAKDYIASSISSIVVSNDDVKITLK